MKNLVVVGIVVILVVALAAYFFTVKNPEMVITQAQISDMCLQINEARNGVSIEVDPAKVDIAPVKGGTLDKPHFELTFQNSELVIDTAAMKERFSELPVMKIPLKTEKLVMIYGPLDNYLSLVSAHSLESKVDLARFLSDIAAPSDQKQDVSIDILFKADLVDFGGYDISPVLKKEEKDALVILGQLFEFNPDIKSSCANFSMVLDVSGGEENGTFEFSAENVRSHQKISPQIFEAFLGSTGEKLDLSELLKPGAPPQVIDAQLDGIKFTGNFPDKGTFEAGLGQYRIMYKLEPSSTAGMFSAGFEYAFKDLDLDVTLTETDPSMMGKIKELARFKEVIMSFKADRLSQTLLETYFELVAATQSQAFKNRDEEEMQQKMTEFSEKLKAELIQSQPIISFSLAPFEHEHFKAEARGSFQVIAAGLPTGSATVTLDNMAGIEEYLQKTNIFKDEEVTGIINGMKAVFVADDKGNGVLSFEIQTNPTKMLLNGQPMKF